MISGTLDPNPPSFSSVSFLKADLPPQPIGLDVLKRIKDTFQSQVNGNILQPGTDNSPFRDFTSIKNYTDDFGNVPGVLIDKPRPQPVIRHKLAILHPNTN